MNHVVFDFLFPLVYSYIHPRHNSEQWYPTGGLDEVFGCALKFYCNHMCTLLIGRRPEVDTGSRSSAWLRNCDSKTRTRPSRHKRCFHCKERRLLVICRRGSYVVDERANCCSRDSKLPSRSTTSAASWSAYRIRLSSMLQRGPHRKTRTGSAGSACRSSRNETAVQKLKQQSESQLQ
jgi:hypothetical protein